MSNTSNMARDTVKEAKDALRDSGRAASEASGDIQADLASLRDDVSKMASQIGDILAARGGAVWRKATANVQDKGMEAVGAVREVGDNMVDAIDESLKRRPYTTLAIAATIGFLFGATWRR
jgi:ElaB/YqjD/DUF883 family membrane-anchored ribosome-binding protein